MTDPYDVLEYDSYAERLREQVPDADPHTEWDYRELTIVKPEPTFDTEPLEAADEAVERVPVIEDDMYETQVVVLGTEKDRTPCFNLKTYTDEGLQDKLDDLADHADEARLERIVDEVINPVDAYVEGEGPAGPWYWRSITIRRDNANVIDVYDVDGEIFEMLHVPDATRDDVVDDLEGSLAETLRTINEQSLEAL